MTDSHKQKWVVKVGSALLSNPDQGLNRQIRRMCEFLGYEVTKLKRTRIMHLELSNLKAGQWRNLTERELATLQNAVKHSVKTV